MRARGDHDVILGCTEISLLVKQADIDRPLFKTLALQVNVAVDFALGEG